MHTRLYSNLCIRNFCTIHRLLRISCQIRKCYTQRGSTVVACKRNDECTATESAPAAAAALTATTDNEKMKKNVLSHRHHNISIDKSWGKKANEARLITFERMTTDHYISRSELSSRPPNQFSFWFQLKQFGSSILKFRKLSPPSLRSLAFGWKKKKPIYFWSKVMQAVRMTIFWCNFIALSLTVCAWVHLMFRLNLPSKWNIDNGAM